MEGKDLSLRTMTHFPFKSLRVFDGGAAMVDIVRAAY